MPVPPSPAGRGLPINPHKGKRYATPPAGFVQRDCPRIAASRAACLQLGGATREKALFILGRGGPGGRLTAWHDGTTHFLFEPVEVLEKLAALTRRPEINLALYHGVLALHARWRPEVVAHHRAESGAATDPGAVSGNLGPGRGSAPRPATGRGFCR